MQEIILANIGNTYLFIASFLNYYYDILRHPLPDMYIRTGSMKKSTSSFVPIFSPSFKPTKRYHVYHLIQNV